MFRTTCALLALTASLPAATRIFQTFEGDGFDTWKTEGAAFGLAPVAGKTDDMEKPFTAYSNDSFASSTHGGTSEKGALVSPEFTIAEPYITFLIAGGNSAGKTAAQLVIDGKVVRESVGKQNLRFTSALWDVTELKGSKAVIRLVDDDDDAGWGFIAIDQIVLTDYPNYKFPPTTREGKAFVEGLEATDVVAGANIPIGSTLKVEATYKDQQVTSPTALTFDDQGRIYLSETHRFREGIEDDRDNLYWYLDDLAAKKTSDRRALHEKWKEKLPIEKLTKKTEIVRRLADTDGDGKIDESKVFADGFNDVLDGTAAGVFYYEGSLYFACIPKIYQLRDTDGDGKADARDVVADGFGVRVSLSGHDLNGFTLGGDGRIYGTVGDRGMSLLTKEGKAYDYPNEGAAFRFEPDGTGFELFHTGLRNPKEIAFDALGNAFSVDNNSDQGDAARVVYLVEGGDSGWQMEHQAMHTFHRQIGLKDHPPSRWMDEKMWELQNPSQPAYILPPSAHLTSGPSGLTANPGAGFLEGEAGRFLIADYRGGSANSGIWSFEMKPKGAGMEMTDSRQFLWGVAATDVEYSWDGKVYISDFITGWASHEDGRLLSLDAGENTWLAADAAGAAKIMKEGFEQRSSAVLANLLKHPDARIRLRAHLALTRKPDGVTRLVEAADSSNFMVRIHAIQGLGVISRRGAALLPKSEFATIPDAKNGKTADDKLTALLADKNAEIRAQALRALADSKSDPNGIPLGPLLGDESPRVRFFAAMLAGKRKMIGYYGPICDLLAENDNRDVYLRHACIFALQQLATKPTLLVGLAEHESAAVRLAAVVALRRIKSPLISNFISDADPKVADEAIRAICDLDMVSIRPEVAGLLDNPASRQWTPFMLRRLVHNSYRLGTPEDAVRVLKVAADASMPQIVRLEALRLLEIWTDPFPVDQLTGHWNPLEKRELSTIQPALLEALPGLLKQDGPVLTAALGLVKHYKLEVPGLDDNALRGLIKNGKLPAEARAVALDLLIRHKPGNLDGFLTEITADPSDEVVLTALDAMAKLSPEKSLPALEAAANSSSAPRAQKTWNILAGVPGEAVDAIFIKQLEALRAANGISPAAIELTAAAKKRKAGPVREALAALEKSLAENSDPLAKWNSSLEGGDPENGAALFASHPASECKRCHRAEEGHTTGGETAPNLVGIANRHKDRRYFLESMINPAAVIAPGFGAVLVDFKNGASLTGNLIADTPEHLDIDAAGKAVRINRADIATVTTPASPMPPMGGLLKPEELRDVIAWLASLDKGGELPKPAAPVPLDPASLLVPASADKSTSAVDPVLMKLGQQQFMVCGACHGQSGEGTAAGPPLAGSEWVTGPEENLIRIQLRGLHGPIKVKGQEYNFPAGMAALAYQTDEQIAAVLTYVRNSFGNSAPVVNASAVTALRGEVGKPPLVAADLVAPSVPQDASPTTSKEVSGKYDNLSKEGFPGKWIFAAAAVIGLAGLGLFLKKK
ncbi:c-type cytochrome [Luteolibacter yonseiensis]|uniref:C-type cytochrome n=1 Tax=Luteolibacter yonseiensis TaxID=1144680 RepID=A0A934R4B6_9BACT|nr:c-type cytochrome [Luteolibacter yonseiensis]MBK1816657.1 c-type cytochrome [Luteolibacter yonseiensis]